MSIFMGIELIGFVAVALLSLVLEAVIGSFPYQIFAFPLNILTLLLWLVVVIRAYRNRKESRFAQFMLSRTATWLSLTVMALIGIALGLQRNPSTTSWLVVVGILFTLTHLLLITMRGWRTAQGIRWRFTLLHAGLIIALGAGFWGAPDRVQLRTMLPTESTITHAYHLDGTMTNLGYALQLRDLDAEYNENGIPTHFEAALSIDNKDVTLRVNHPYNRTFSEKIYLVSIGNDASYCVVEIVREPWQWASLAGIILLLAGAVMLFLRGPRHAANPKTK